MTPPHKTTLIPLELLHKALPHPHHTNNANEELQQSTNDRIALWISGHIGTMRFCYVLACLMLLWACLQVLLGQRAFDAFPFPFLFFCLGGVMQSLLLPLIMVAQNLDQKKSEILANTQYKTTQNIYHDSEQILAHLDAQDVLLLQLTKKHISE